MATAAEELIQRGKAEGKVEGKAEAILAVLEARGITVGEEQRARIIGSKDVSELDRWLRAALEVRNVAELLARRPEG